MARKHKPKTLVEQLRQAVLDSGETPYRVAKDSGADYSVLLRFLADERGITLETASLLAEYLELELTPKRKRR